MDSRSNTTLSQIVTPRFRWSIVFTGELSFAWNSAGSELGIPAGSELGNPAGSELRNPAGSELRNPAGSELGSLAGSEL